MKRKLRNAISAILVFTLILSLTFSTFASEKTLSKEKEPLVVTCICDSIANGYRQDWACETTPLGSPYNEAAHKEEIHYMSQECHDAIYPLDYYSYYKGLAYAREETDMFCVLTGYVDEYSIAAVKEDIDDTSKAIAACTDENEKAELQKTLDGLNTRYADMTDPEKAAEINENLIRTYESKTLRTFPAQVAAELNGRHVSEFDSFEDYYQAVPYRSLTASGLHAKDVRYMLDPDFKEKIDSQTEHENLWYWFGDYLRHDNRTVTKEYYETQLEGTDLLLLQLGGNDVLTATLYDFDDSFGSDLVNDLTAAIQKLSYNMSESIECMNWILDYCLEKNPDMKIMLVGLSDYYLNNNLSTYHYSLSEDKMTILYNSMLAITTSYNSFLRQYADTHDGVYFVDINSFPMTSAATQSGDNSHPSNEGHDYITRRILSALPNDLNSKHLYDISVDLQGIYDPQDPSGKIVSVSVDGKSVSSYETDGYTVTIHYWNAYANLVEVVTEGKTVGKVVWQACYNRSDGYRTYQIVKDPDVKSTISKVFNKPELFTMS